MSGLPAWWTSNMLDLIQRREPMPNVERLQTAYVKYRRANDAQVAGAAGWDATISRRNYEQMARTLDPHHCMDHPLYSPLSPDNVTMRIVEAPAEFGVPVKQDRRLSPSFKVRVEVRYRQRVAVPITVKAHLVTQQDKDNILAWLPDDYTPYTGLEDKSQRSMTELKGNTCITHHFEANNGGITAPAMLGGGGLGGLGGAADRGPQGLLGGAGMRGLGLGGGVPGVGGLGGGLGDLRAPPPGTRLLDTSPSALATLKTLGIKGGGMMGWGAQGVPEENKQAMMEHLLLQQGAGHGGVMGGHSNGLDPGLLGGGAGNTFGGNPVHQLMTQLGGNMLMLNNGAQEVQAVQQQLQQLQQKQQRQQQQQQAAAAAAAAQGEAAAAVAHAQQLMLAGMGGSSGETSVLSHDFEFTNLELLKPTRMNKVYLVFCCTIMDLDALYVVFNVPTIGICRAEQREKACQKLSVPMPLSLDSAVAAATAATPTSTVGMGAAGGLGGGMGHAGMDGGTSQAVPQPHARKRSDRMGMGESDESEGFQPMTSNPMARMAAAGGSGAGGASREVDMGGAAAPRTRMALQEWILEEYEGTGLTRKLTRLDLQALLSQAGFPTDAAHEHATVSQVQWDEFCGQFRVVLHLLRQIAGVWNLEDPCVVCGFDMDRQGTIQALANEPAGTFLCRFSMSQPGCLVLSCKTTHGHPNADADGLIHAIINIDDLHERRVDTWIRDYVGASHVLDVYRQKRVDKRKVFTSNYTRLKGLDPTPMGPGSEYGGGFGSTEVA